MQTEIGKKIVEIIKSRHSEIKNKNRLKCELRFLEENGLLKDIYVLYQKIQKSSNFQGNRNIINSYVAYLLGITTKLPEREFKLEKRRTYARSGFPDIDMDFNHQRRDEVSEYLFEKYGRDKVANIGTIQKLKTKNAVRRVIKVIDPEHHLIFDSNGKIKDGESQRYQLENEIAKTLPIFMRHQDGSLVKSIKEAYEEFPMFRTQMDAYPKVYEAAQRLEGGIAAAGSHAAGFVLSPVPLCQIAPLHNTTEESAGKKKKTIATQYPANDTESLGLIKFDLLGLMTKTVITMALSLIKEKCVIDIDNLPLDDQKTLDLLNSGMTDGVFQLENPGMKRTVKEIHMDSFKDLAVAIAMYRPGPMQFISEYARRKKNPESVTYLHPIVKKYTESTYGIIVYQETVMQIFVELADLTAVDGYLFIKGAAKKKPELFMSMKKRFIEGAAKKSSRKIAEQVWNQFQPFMGYAFNMAHAVSYGYESWKTAYLKAHYPVEFMAARLSIAAADKKFDEVDKYERDCKNWNIDLLSPDINHSKLVYTIAGERSLRKPLIFKDVGESAAKEIVAHQPYKGPDVLYSFASKVGSSVSTKIVEAMCDAGLFGQLKKASAKKYFEQIKSDRKKTKGRQTSDMFG